MKQFSEPKVHSRSSAAQNTCSAVCMAHTDNDVICMYLGINDTKIKQMCKLTCFDTVFMWWNYPTLSGTQLVSNNTVQSYMKARYSVVQWWANIDVLVIGKCSYFKIIWHWFSSKVECHVCFWDVPFNFLNLKKIR